jgi:hypothetical protein
VRSEEGEDLFYHQVVLVPQGLVVAELLETLVLPNHRHPPRTEKLVLHLVQRVEHHIPVAAVTSRCLLGSQLLHEEVHLLAGQGRIPVQGVAAEFVVVGEQTEGGSEERVDDGELVGKFEDSRVGVAVVLQFFLEFLQVRKESLRGVRQQGGHRVRQVQEL